METNRHVMVRPASFFLPQNPKVAYLSLLLPIYNHSGED